MRRQEGKIPTKEYFLGLGTGLLLQCRNQQTLFINKPNLLNTVMNKFSKVLCAALLAGLTLMTTSCDKNNKNNPEPQPKKPTEVKKAEYIDATAYDKWTYFSFATGKVVEVAKPETSTEWDVAFNRANIRVNAALGYPGKAGVVMTGSTDFNAEIKTAGLEFKTNVEAMLKVESGMGLPEGQAPKMEKQKFVYVGKPNTYQLFDIDMKKMMEGAAAMYPVRKNIFVFRAADGKTYYKLRMTGSTNAKGKRGATLSFQYQEL